MYTLSHEWIFDFMSKINDGLLNEPRNRQDYSFYFICTEKLFIIYPKDKLWMKMETPNSKTMD